MAIGKKGIIGDIDVMRIAPHGDDLPQHGETAEAGIEDENGRK